MPSNKGRSAAKKIRAVRYYLNTKQSVRTVADRFSVSYSTLYSWVKQYKKNGENGLRRTKESRKRVTRATEHEVVMIKERKPFLSINATQRILKKKGITISQKGIWQIWRHHGLGKRSAEHPLNTLCAPTRESTNVIKKARAFVKNNQLQNAAHIINELPCVPDIPESHILTQIPEKMFCPRRKLDRAALELGAVPFVESQRKARRISKTLEKQGYLYSSILADFVELQASGWTGTAQQRLKLLEHMEKKMHGLKDTALWFFHYSQLAMVYSDLLEINKALRLTKKCRKLVHLLPPPDYHAALGSLMTFLGRYKEAGMFFESARQATHEPVAKARLALMVAYSQYCIAGDYKKGRKMLSRAIIVKHAPVFGASRSLYEAYVAFGEGNLGEAHTCCIEALKKATKGEVHNVLYGTSIALAAISMALHKKREARKYLRKYRTLMKKVGCRHEAVTLEQLLDSGKVLPRKLQLMPASHLLSLMVRAHTTNSIACYRKAFRYAQRHKIEGLLHRLVVFFPHLVVRLLKMGKRTGLPRAILRFPIFNEQTPAYHVKFLGDFVTFKGNQYLRTKLSPKEKAFFIHLALRAGTPGASIIVKELYTNFWPASKNPHDLLLHLLTNVKRKLSIPSHLLTVSSAYAQSRLVNRGLYITTDFATFETLFTQSQSLERAGEWALARRDYTNAFALVRGEPFKKMYDPWSEQTRTRILVGMEEKGLHFARRCLDTEDIDVARKVLERIVYVAPDADEARALLEKTHRK